MEPPHDLPNIEAGEGNEALLCQLPEIAFSELFTALEPASQMNLFRSCRAVRDLVLRNCTSISYAVQSSSTSHAQLGVVSTRSIDLPLYLHGAACAAGVLDAAAALAPGPTHGWPAVTTLWLCTPGERLPLSSMQLLPLALPSLSHLVLEGAVHLQPSHFANLAALPALSQLSLQCVSFGGPDPDAGPSATQMIEPPGGVAAVTWEPLPQPPSARPVVTQPMPLHAAQHASHPQHHAHPSLFHVWHLAPPAHAASSSHHAHGLARYPHGVKHSTDLHSMPLQAWNLPSLHAIHKSRRRASDTHISPLSADPACMDFVSAGAVDAPSDPPVTAECLGLISLLPHLSSLSLFLTEKLDLTPLAGLGSHLTSLALSGSHSVMSSLIPEDGLWRVTLTPQQPTHGTAAAEPASAAAAPPAPDDAAAGAAGPDPAPMQWEASSPSAHAQAGASISGAGSTLDGPAQGGAAGAQPSHRPPNSTSTTQHAGLPQDPWAACGLPLCAFSGLREVRVDGVSKTLRAAQLAPLAAACKQLTAIRLSACIDGPALAALLAGLPELSHLGLAGVCSPMPDTLPPAPSLHSLQLGRKGAPMCELDVHVAARLPLGGLTKTCELHGLVLVVGQSLLPDEARTELTNALHNLASAPALHLVDGRLGLFCRSPLVAAGLGGASLFRALAPLAPHVRALGVCGPEAELVAAYRAFAAEGGAAGPLELSGGDLYVLGDALGVLPMVFGAGVNGESAGPSAAAGGSMIGGPTAAAPLSELADGSAAGAGAVTRPTGAGMWHAHGGGRGRDHPQPAAAVQSGVAGLRAFLGAGGLVPGAPPPPNGLLTWQGQARGGSSSGDEDMDTQAGPSASSHAAAGAVDWDQGGEGQAQVAGSEPSTSGGWTPQHDNNNERPGSSTCHTGPVQAQAQGHAKRIETLGTGSTLGAAHKQMALEELQLASCVLRPSFWSALPPALPHLRALELGRGVGGAVGVADLAHAIEVLPQGLELRASALARQQEAAALAALAALEALGVE